MKGLLLVVAFAACALARPDIGLKIREGYKYQPPATSYGIPTGSYLPGVQSNSQFAPTGTGYHQQSSNTFVSSGPVGNGYTGQGTTYQGPSTTGYQSSQTYQSQNFNQGGFDRGGVEHGFTGQNNYNQQYSGQAQVHKHVYFFDSPEDLPAPTIRLSGQASAGQKNYKIIFIKAPAYQAPVVPQIPIQQQNEEKTLVYVLVKKPDEGQEIVVPTLSPSKPSKPEVYFIKYNTQKEAEAQIHTIQQGSSSGVSANSVDSDAAFISTIRDAQVSHHGDGTSGGQLTGGGSTLITSSNNDGLNQQIFGGDVRSHEGSSSTHSVTGTGSSQIYGPAGASGPY